MDIPATCCHRVISLSLSLHLPLLFLAFFLVFIEPPQETTFLNLCDLELPKAAGACRSDNKRFRRGGVQRFSICGRRLSPCAGVLLRRTLVEANPHFVHSQGIASSKPLRPASGRVY